MTLKKATVPLHIPLNPYAAFGLSPLRTINTVEYFAGRPIVRWTRYGFWDESGTIFTATRVK